MQPYTQPSIEFDFCNTKSNQKNNSHDTPGIKPDTAPPTPAQGFIAALTGNADAICDWRVIHPEKKYGLTQAHKKRGTLADVWQWLQAMNSKGFGVYVTVQQTNGRGVKSADIAELYSCFADFDPTNGTPYTEQQKAEIVALLNNSTLPPHLIVDSGRGIHGYWLLKPGQPVADFQNTQKAISTWFKSDKAVSDPARVMRLPGSVHTKAEPLPVKLLACCDDLPRYTLEQIRTAYPAPSAPPRSKPAPIYSDTADSSDYGRTLALTQGYMRKIAADTKEGGRHNALKGLVAAIVGRDLKPSDAEALVLEFCQLTGLPDDEGLLTWAQEKGGFSARLPELKHKELNTRRCRPLKDTAPSKESVRADLYEYMAALMYTPDNRMHLLTPTPGLGKTSALAAVLNELHAKAWPERDNGTPAKYLVLVDTHSLAEELAAKLAFEVEIYKGRNKDNLCDSPEMIKGTETPASYCKAHCVINKAGACRYYPYKNRVMQQRIVIAAKQAFLHDSADFSEFDALVIDEDLSGHLYHQNTTFSRDDLITVKQAIEQAGLEQGQRHQAERFIDGLLKEMDKPEPTGKDPEKIRRAGVTVESAKIERVFSMGNGQFLKPRRFFSLLQGKFDLSITRRMDKAKGSIIAALHVTARRERLIEQLKGKTIINLDATPIRALLKEFSPLEFARQLDQNLIYYQESDYGFTKTALTDSRTNGIANDRIRGIMARVTGKTAVFTAKRDEGNLAALLPPDTQIGVFGRDGRGSNAFEDCDNFIIKGLFTHNLGAVKALARVAGVKADALTRDKRDAEILQVIGRARGVNRIKPANVFILTNNRGESLPLDKKPKRLSDWLKATPPIENKPPSVPTIEAATMKSAQPRGFEAQKTPSAQPIFDRFLQAVEPAPIKAIRRHVEAHLAEHGFYVHDFAGMGSGSFCQPLEALANVSKAQYHRYIQQVLKSYESGTVTLDEGITVKVWGDKQKAIDFITCPLELAEAIEHVKAEYRRPDGLVDMVLTLGEFNIRGLVREYMAERDYTRDNWAILIYRHHKRRRIEPAITV